MQPRAYSTPLIFAFQIGLPNQMANRSTLRPRQRAARKCPSSCTKISRLNSNKTSIRIKTNFTIDIINTYFPSSWDAQEYSSDRTRSNPPKNRMLSQKQRNVVEPKPSEQ